MTAPLPPGLHPTGQIVFTRDGQRLGKIEVIGREAFKVESTDGGVWLRHEAVARTTDGGLVILLGTKDELDEWQWQPPRIRLTPDYGDDS